MLPASSMMQLSSVKDRTLLGKVKIAKLLISAVSGIRKSTFIINSYFCDVLQLPHSSSSGRSPSKLILVA